MLTSRTAVSLKDLTDAALNEEFQFAPTRSTATSRGASGVASVGKASNLSLLSQSSFGRAFGGRAALRSSGELPAMLARGVSPNSSFQSLLPLRAQAGTSAGAATASGGNLNALLATSGDFHFRPNSSVVGGPLLAVAANNDSFAFTAPTHPSGASALALGLARAGSSGHLASAIAAQVTTEGNSSVEGPRLFAGGHGNLSAASALLAAHADARASATAADDDDDDDDGDEVQDDISNGQEKHGAPASRKAAHAAAARRRASKPAAPKRRRVSDVATSPSAAGAPTAAAAAATTVSVADTGKKKLSRAEARTKLRAEQRLAEEALPMIPLFESVSEAQAFHKRVQSETAAKSKQPKIRAVVARPEMRGTFVDLTDFLALPQSDAAKMIGVPTSTLSKRWKEVIDERKWPYRTVGKLDKEIFHLLSSGDVGKLDAVRRLLATRQAVLMPVSLRISKLEKLKPDVLPPGLDLTQFKVDDDDDDDDDADADDAD